MMLNSLLVQRFRCFDKAHFQFHPRFNFISGENGVGKTALLEAISLLSVGRSFRTRENQPLIHSHYDEFILFATIEAGQSISIKKSRSLPTQIRINEQACLKTSELTSFLPSQVIYQDLFDILDAGPMIRRQALDWGMFHVKQNYHAYLNQYRQALKQRNMLLKSRAKPAQLSAWNQTLSELADWIDQARNTYWLELTPLFKSILSQLSDVKCELSYFNGWDKEKKGIALADILEANYESDIQRQYTQHGVHCADFEMTNETGKAKWYLSRGQQKMILLALKLAQAQIIDKPCLYLWDDVCSELDEAHIQALSDLLSSIKGQFFISGIQIGKSSLVKQHQGNLIALKSYG